MENCLFCRISNGEIPADIVYQSDDFLAFSDIAPQAPIHVVVIPRAHINSIMDPTDSSLMGSLLLAVQHVASLLRVDRDGFRTVINCGENGGQTVNHLHVHLLGGRFMQWPPG